MRRGDFGSGLAEAKQAASLAQNARQMVINRDPRFVDLAALVTQQTVQIATITGNLTDLTTALAANSNADAATKMAVQRVGSDLAAVQVEVTALADNLTTATSQLAAENDELADRMTAAETALRDEATVRAAADAAEAKTRADADAAEARARADADTSNAALAAAATKAEADARKAADTAEQTARAAADTALAARLAALENKMTGVTSGRKPATVVTLAAGATLDVAVTFDAAAPDATYVPLAILSTDQFTPAGFKNQTTAGVTVTLRAKAAITLSVTLTVTIVALKL